MRSSPATIDGWRALPGVGYAEPQLLAALDQAATGGALGTSVLVAYDSRAGARELAQLAADLLASRGLTCYLATGPTPTPAAGRLVHHEPHLQAAVIVTASHNPPGFLGIKLRDDQGQGLLWLPSEDDRVAPIDTLPPAPQPHSPIDVLAPIPQPSGAPSPPPRTDSTGTSSSTPRTAPLALSPRTSPNSPGTGLAPCPSLADEPRIRRCVPKPMTSPPLCSTARANLAAP